MKNNFILTTFLALCSFALFAQNPIWICPPNSVNPSGGIPIPLPTGQGQINNSEDPTDYYDASFRIHGSANGMQDVNGDLKFFVVDGLIYDADGKFLDYVFTNTFDVVQNQNTNNYKIKYATNNTIGPETIIVPHPVNCNQYYIFSTYVNQTVLKDQLPEDTIPPTPDYDSTAMITTFPIYCLFDADQGIVLDKGLWYSDPTIANNNPYLNNPSILTASNALNPQAGDSPMTPLYWGDKIGLRGISGIGVTDIQPNGSRYLVCYFQNFLLTLEIKNDGSIVYNKRFELGPPGSSNKSSELEVVFDALTNQWIIATSNGFFGGNIHVIRLSQNMQALISNENVDLPLLNSYAEATGIEFSPDLSKVIVTYTNATNLAVSNLCFIDLDVFPYSATSLLSNSLNSSEIKYGFIESDGVNLLIASLNGIYRLSNPNTPDISNLSSTPIINIPIDTSNTGNSLNSFNQYFYHLPDQIDGMDYSAHFYTDVACCKAAVNFDKTTFTATSNATWLPGFNSNPLDASNDGNNVITIRDELRIPKGKIVNIKNMTIEFAPGAKLIIEEGDGVLNGGRLNLENTKLTVDTRCTDDELWEGVEVWGNAALVQGIPTGNSQQGRLFIIGNSTIEHAKKGVVLSAFNNTTGTYTASKGGGVLRATGTTFRNNQRDIVFWNYQSPNGTNNYSYVTDCNFITDAVLKSGVFPINHVEIRGVRGVALRGNDFKHINTEYHRVGNGIFATNSTFTVAAGCTSGTIPCTSFDPNRFENLNLGIFVTNSSSILTFNVDRNEFINNNVGIRANSTNLASITRNNFKVYETPNYQTGGVYLFKSTKYVVEENNFGIVNANALSGAKAYGLVINNSGPESNLVYRNNFEDLYIGGQSELTNANTQIGNATGLVWKCNTFRDISQNDLTVIKGNIAYNQGYMDPSNAITANQKAANNQFSLQFENSAIAHDFFLAGAEPINYVYTQGAMTIPDSYTTSFMTIQQSSVNGNPVNFDYVSGCPSRIGKTKIQLNSDLVVLQNKVNQNTSILNAGTLATLQSTLNLTNAGNKKNQLLAKSPYLSDEVLIAYMLQSPPNGHLQQVLNANSPLSQAVLDVLLTRNIPNGILNNILANQSTSPSSRTILQQDTWYTEANLYRTIDDLLREVILDTNSSRTLDDAVTILAPRQEKIYQEMLVNLKITRNELLDATNLLTITTGYGRTQELNGVQINMRAASDPSCYLMNSLTDQQLLQNIAADSAFCVCSERAKALLCELTPLDESYYFLEDENSIAKSSMTIPLITENEVFEDWQVVLYPNPTNSTITVLNNESSKMSIAVYDVLGSLQTSIESIENASVVDISAFKNGVYLFVIHELSSGKTKTVRVMKK
ncbi:MAG: T9SS type A sorting domain-containing protein [Fluviicola sp.]|nr:T9SS type A sorting domain-containing protein [Fluviicola sp.]